MDLPAPISRLLQPLFAALPLEQALSQLVVEAPASGEQVTLVEKLLQEPTLSAPLRAGLWLYVDELDRSHKIAQKIEDETGSFWHGIMHRREGDFSNSHYWFNKVGKHPAMNAIPGYDPHAFIDAVAGGKGDRAALVALQRREWEALFGWCASQP